MRNEILIYGVCAVVLLLVAMVHRVGAQESNPLVEEILVTAQKRVEVINDVPIAINAYSGEALDQLGVQDTRDLGNLVPGFSVADSGYNAPIYQLRGIGFNEKSHTASSTVGVYLDEVNLPFPVLTKGANLDLERVEVLKGPQGTLYGRNTTGGAVNYIAKKPSDALEAGISGRFGRFLTSELEAYVTGPITETLLARIAVKDVRSQEGWQESITRHGDGSNDPRNPSPSTPGEYDTLGEKDNQAARLKLAWQPLDALTLNLSLDWWQDRGEPQAGQSIRLSPSNPFLRALGPSALHPDARDYPILSPASRDSRAADWPQNVKRPWELDDRFLMGTLRADWNLSEDIDLTFLGQYARFDADDALPSSGLDTFNQHTYQTVETRVYGGELRLTGRTGDVDWVTGLYASRDEVFEFDDVPLETGSAAFNVVPGVVPIGDWASTFGDQTAKVYAAFASTNWQFTETLRLTLGGRFTSEERSYRGCTRDSDSRTQGVGYFTVFNALSLSRGGSGGIQDGECVTLDAETGDPVPSDGARLNLDESNVSLRVALDWTPLEGLLTYASYGRGFKSGSFPVLSGATTGQYQPATQEKLDAFEVGAKSELWDGFVRANTAAFYYAYEDKQLLGSIPDPVFGQLPKLNNAPRSRVYGFELDVSSSPLDGLYLAAALAYVNTEIREYSGTSEFGDQMDFSGRPFNYAPEVEYSLIANYVHSLTERLDLMVGADYGWSAETNASLAEIREFEIPSYGLVGARLGLADADRAWEVGFFGRNLTDAFVVNNVLNPGDDISRRTGMPTTYGIMFKYIYG